MDKSIVSGLFCIFCFAAAASFYQSMTQTLPSLVAFITDPARPYLLLRSQWRKWTISEAGRGEQRT